MGQEAGENSTASADLQPTIPESDALPGSRKGKKQRAAAAGFRATMSLPVKAFHVATQSVDGLA